MGSREMYNERPELTRQSIHESVVQRFQSRPKDPWPESFASVIQGMRGV